MLESGQDFEESRHSNVMEKERVPALQRWGTQGGLCPAEPLRLSSEQEGGSCERHRMGTEGGQRETAGMGAGQTCMGGPWPMQISQGLHFPCQLPPGSCGGGKPGGGS